MSENIEAVIRTIEQFKLRTYPFGKDYDYSKNSRILGVPSWQEYEELKKKIQSILGIKKDISPIKRTIKKKKQMKPHSGGFNKPCILNKKMTNIVKSNLLEGNPKYQFDAENRIIYTPGLLTNWWSKYIHKEKLRSKSNKTILKYEKLLQFISQNYLSEVDIDLNANPNYIRIKKVSGESEEDFQKKKESNKDRRFTYTNLQKILAKYIDLRLKEKSYFDYETYFDAEKTRLETYYPVIKTELNKKINLNEKSSKLNVDSSLKQEILDILNEDNDNSEHQD